MKSKRWKPSKEEESWLERATEEFYQMMMNAQRTGEIDLRTDASGRMRAAIKEALEYGPRPVGLQLHSISIPDKKTTEGILVCSTSALWTEIVARLHNRWEEAYAIPAQQWEELI